MRKLLLALGAILVFAGFALTVAWFNQSRAPKTVSEAPKPEEIQKSILTASHNIQAGTLLRQGDVSWKQVPDPEIRPEYLVQNQVSDADFIGAITRRDFAAGEAFISTGLVKVSDQNFLAATLARGSRAVSLSFEQPQAGSGLAAASALVLPGDHVDVILTQHLETAGDPARRLVGETVLRDVRVVAIDRTFGVAWKTQPEESKQVRGEMAATPRTVTLEVTERQAQALFVAAQLGKLHLSVRPVIDAGLKEDEERRLATVSTWASDVSPALLEYTPKSAGPTSTTGSSIESSIRRLPAPGH
jgi:pilus assembly protein CpaB